MESRLCSGRVDKWRARPSRLLAEEGDPLVPGGEVVYTGVFSTSAGPDTELCQDALDLAIAA